MTRRRLALVAIVVVAGIAAIMYASGLFSSAPVTSLAPHQATANFPRILPDNPKEAQAVLARAKRELGKLLPREPYVVVDCHANRVIYRTLDSIIIDAEASTGSGGELVDSATGNRWVFNTPRGVFKVKSKTTDPWWRKPDWAFIEEGEAIPTKNEERMDPNMMGDYAIGFGDGYFIHGTIYERLLGVGVTHGCVRVGAGDLKKLFTSVRMGQSIYII